MAVFYGNLGFLSSIYQVLHRMLPRILPLLAGLMPFTAMCGAFGIGVAYEVLPPCNPFLDGCVSISATGRKPPGSFLFRAIMLPYSIVLGFLWYFTAAWLRALQRDTTQSSILVLLISGYVGASALVVYVTFLGTSEPVYEFMRRTGIYFGFLGTGVAQLTASLALLRVSRAVTWPGLKRQARVLLTISWALFGMGILNIVLKSILEDADNSENRIEWIAALFMQIHFLIMYRVWRMTGFNASVGVGEPRSSQ
jgi:hypothetical protein